MIWNISNTAWFQIKLKIMHWYFRSSILQFQNHQRGRWHAILLLHWFHDANETVAFSYYHFYLNFLCVFLGFWIVTCTNRQQPSMVTSFVICIRSNLIAKVATQTNFTVMYMNLASFHYDKNAWSIGLYDNLNP